MNIDTIRANILELSSESEHGSWEFWLSKPKDRTSEEANEIVEAIVNLVKEKKIFPMEDESVKNKSYKETTLDLARLRDQVMTSMNPDNRENLVGNYYWFLATEDGKKEDMALRSKKV